MSQNEAANYKTEPCVKLHNAGNKRDAFMRIDLIVPYFSGGEGGEEGRWVYKGKLNNEEVCLSRPFG